MRVGRSEPLDFVHPEEESVAGKPRNPQIAAWIIIHDYRQMDPILEIKLHGNYRRLAAAEHDVHGIRAAAGAQPDPISRLK
jgi:hypothetical protein